MKILIIDNYDSFTFNLYQYVGSILKEKEIKFKLDVKRNNEITVNEIKKKGYERIIISPGPGSPSASSYFGICREVLVTIGQNTPVFGVCLGMQGMAYCFGGKVIPAKIPMHGKTSLIKHDNLGVFKDLPQRLKVMRYHSLVADPKNISGCLKVTATVIQENQDDHIEIMGLRHKKYPIEGVQFHPESFGTENGIKMLANFLNYVISTGSVS